MPVPTLGYARETSRSSVAPQEILSPSYRLKMIGVYASSIAAEMIEIETFRDRPKKRLVGYSMRREVSSASDDLTISIGKGSRP